MPPHSLTLMAKKLAGYIALSKSDLSALNNIPHFTHEVEKGNKLVRVGNVPDSCSILISGFACTTKYTNQGGRQIVAIHYPGDIIGFYPCHFDVNDCGVETLMCCSISTIRQSDLRALAFDHAKIGQALAVSAFVDNSIFREWIINIGRRDARTRIAHLLCEFAARLDGKVPSPGQNYILPLNQGQLGDALGLTSVHVNRMINRLIDDGLLTQDNRTITFPAWHELKTEADFNSGYLHLRENAATSGYF